MLETIEATIRDHYNKDKSSSSSNDSSESKRRRNAADVNSNEDDFIESTSKSKKRSTKKQSQNSEVVNLSLTDQFEDIDFDDDLFDVRVSEADQGGGRVLPSWSTQGSSVHG